jgi:hypothetical protein
MDTTHGNNEVHDNQETHEIEIKRSPLSYDKIIKGTLAESKEMTIRFINGLFGDNIPIDAPVTWLDKETVNDKHVGFIADFYPKIDGRMYSIELEHDDKGDMAVRVFRYTFGGAMLHGMKSDKSRVDIDIPQPAVVFLRNNSNTPQKLIWDINFFDGQKITLEIPTVRLSDMSIAEMSKRNLFPVGQFYLRKFEPLTSKNRDEFIKATAELVAELQRVVEAGTVPYHIGKEMYDTIYTIVRNIIKEADEEVDKAMTTNIVETIPWIDYGEVFRKLEAKSRAEGIVVGKAEGIAEGEAKGRTEGRTERDMEIAVKAFSKQKQGINMTAISQTLRDLGISDEIIEAARRQHDAERMRENRKRTERER